MQIKGIQEATLDLINKLSLFQILRGFQGLVLSKTKGYLIIDFSTIRHESIILYRDQETQDLVALGKDSLKIFSKVELILSLHLYKRDVLQPKLISCLNSLDDIELQPMSIHSILSIFLNMTLPIKDSNSDLKALLKHHESLSDTCFLNEKSGEIVIKMFDLMKEDQIGYASQNRETSQVSYNVDCSNMLYPIWKKETSGLFLTYKPLDFLNLSSVHSVVLTHKLPQDVLFHYLKGFKEPKTMKVMIDPLSLEDWLYTLTLVVKLLDCSGLLDISLYLNEKKDFTMTIRSNTVNKRGWMNGFKSAILYIDPNMDFNYHEIHVKETLINMDNYYLFTIPYQVDMIQGIVDFLLKKTTYWQEFEVLDSELKKIVNKDLNIQQYQQMIANIKALETSTN